MSYLPTLPLLSLIRIPPPPPSPPPPSPPPPSPPPPPKYIGEEWVPFGFLVVFCVKMRRGGEKKITQRRGEKKRERGEEREGGGEGGEENGGGWEGGEGGRGAGGKACELSVKYPGSLLNLLFLKEKNMTIIRYLLESLCFFFCW